MVWMLYNFTFCSLHWPFKFMPWSLAFEKYCFSNCKSNNEAWIKNSTLKNEKILIELFSFGNFNVNFTFCSFCNSIVSFSSCWLNLLAMASTLPPSGCSNCFLMVISDYFKEKQFCYCITDILPDKTGRYLRRNLEVMEWQKSRKQTWKVQFVCKME